MWGSISLWLDLHFPDDQWCRTSFHVSIGHLYVFTYLFAICMNEKNDNFSFLTEFQSDNFNARSKLKIKISQDFQTLSMDEMYGQEGNAHSWN